MLYIPPENECRRLYGLYELPSPEDLKGKIIIKDRKIGNDDDPSPCIVLEDDEEDSGYGSFRDWSDSRKNSISANGSLQNFRRSPEASNKIVSEWDDLQSETTEVEANQDYLAKTHTNYSEKYLDKSLINDENDVSEEQINQIEEPTEATSSSRFVEEGTRTPIQMALRSSKDELKENNFSARESYSHEKVKELHCIEKNLGDQESLTRSIESIYTLNDDDRLLYKSISSTHSSSSSVRGSTKSQKKNSVTSLVESESTVNISYLKTLKLECKRNFF